MLKDLQTLCLFFIVVLNLLFLVTDATIIRLSPNDGDCGKKKGSWWAQGVSLDSNHQGDAYLHLTHYGDHQKWLLIPSTGGWMLRNVATDLYLDSDHGGNIYTHQYNGGHFQKWRMLHHEGRSYWFKNVATGRQLDCHRYKAYTWPPNDETSQRWDIFYG